MKMEIPLFRIYWDDEDIRKVNEVIRSGMRWCIGPQVSELEERIKDYLDVKHCMTFNSGGSALHALMIAHGIGPGDEVIVPSFTFIATAYAPLYVGASPVFADIDERTLGLDPEDVERRITKKTKAILPIHYGGLPARIDDLRAVADKHGLILIEDAAEAFGAMKGDRYIGTIGDSAIFSFCQNKIFTTSEGGCAVTDSDEIYEKLKLLSSYGRVMEGNYFESAGTVDYVLPGYNWRLSSILAALGLSQMEKVDELINMRRRNAAYMNRSLSKLDEVSVLEGGEDEKAVYQLYSIMISGGKERRDALMDHLLKKGIASKVYFEPVHRYSVFSAYAKDVDLPVTERISSGILTLPMYPHMTEDEMNYVIDAIYEFYGVRS